MKNSRLLIGRYLSHVILFKSQQYRGILQLQQRYHRKFIGIYGRHGSGDGGSDLGESQLGNFVGGDVVEFNVVVDQLAPDQIGKNQPMDHAPD